MVKELILNAPGTGDSRKIDYLEKRPNDRARLMAGICQCHLVTHMDNNEIFSQVHTWELARCFGFIGTESEAQRSQSPGTQQMHQKDSWTRGREEPEAGEFGQVWLSNHR